MSIAFYRGETDRRWAQVGACHFPHILRELVDEHLVICVVFRVEWCDDRGEILGRWRSYEYAPVSLISSPRSPDYPPMSSSPEGPHLNEYPSSPPDPPY